MEPIRHRGAHRRSTSHLGPDDERTLADDVLDGLTRPFKELPPKHFYDARGAELFDRDLRAARVLPDAHRAGDPRGARRRDRRAHRRRRARRAAARARPPKTRVLLDAIGDAGTLRALRAGRRHRGHGPRLRRGARRGVPRPARARDRRRLRAPPRRACPRPTARGSSRSSAARSATSRRAAGGASCARSRKTSGPDDHLLLGTDLVKDPRDHRGRLRRQRRRDRRVQPQRARRPQPRARRRLRPRRLRARRVLRPRARVDRDAPARAAGARRCASASSGSRSTSPRARSCAPRSARSSRPSGSAATWPPRGSMCRRSSRIRISYSP